MTQFEKYAEEILGKVPFSYANGILQGDLDPILAGTGCPDYNPVGVYQIILNKPTDAVDMYRRLSKLFAELANQCS